MKISELSKWDIRWMNRAKDYASWSKDPSSKIGAVAVDPNRKIELVGGYNGFPRNIDDSTTRYLDRPTKYKLIVHAEMNVIANAAYHGISLDGSHLYVYGLPVCSDCAKVLINTGIEKVYMRYPRDINDKWKESAKDTYAMFEEANIEVELMNDW